MDAHDHPEEYVEEYIGYTFKNHKFIEEAVKRPENRRLGMLGDKIVGILLLDEWYRASGLGCQQGNYEIQRWGSNSEMANEARSAKFDKFMEPDFLHLYGSKGYDHDLATVVEAIIGAVWVDSHRDWEVPSARRWIARLPKFGTEANVR
ncbi:hypothetical protein BDV19DRAFT_384514 [Aspergillus venezuelensis]